VLAWDHDAAVAYGGLRAALERAGTPLGALDTLIAAHALAAGAVLVTHDAAFHRLRTLAMKPGLQVVDWATDLPG
jgi:tRNA(fMet)-specific endonuclease VapC